VSCVLFSQKMLTSISVILFFFNILVIDFESLHSNSYLKISNPITSLKLMVDDVVKLLDKKTFPKVHSYQNKLRCNTCNVTEEWNA